MQRRRNDTVQRICNDTIVVEVSLRFVETCQSAPGASPNVEISCPDCSKVGRIVECRLKQKEAYGLHPTTSDQSRVFLTASDIVFTVSVTLEVHVTDM